MLSQAKRILVIPLWYPFPKDPMMGLFVQNQIRALQNQLDMAVVAVIPDPNLPKAFDLVPSKDFGFLELRIYYRKSKLPVLKEYINGFRFLLAHLKGHHYILKHWGLPNLIHVQVLTRSAVAAWLWKLRYKIPFVITEHWSRYMPQNASFRGWLKQMLTRFVVGQSAGISTVSLALKRAMQLHQIAHINWQIIPNSIDTQRFLPSEKPLNDGLIHLLHISCMEEQSKNVSGILQAFQLASEQNPSLRLHLVGDGVDKESILRWIDILQLHEKVIWEGVLQGEDLVMAYAKAHFTVLFSHYETFAIVVAESLAMGKPVIASRVGAIPEVLPEEFGIFVEDSNVQELATAILIMAQNHSSYDSVAMRLYVQHHFDTQIVAQKYLDFYRV